MPAQPQPPAAPPAPQQPAVESAVRGDVRIGDKSLAIGEVKDGGVVNVTMAREGARARRSPVHQLPQRIEGLLDREEEVRQASFAFPTLKPVEYCGEGGIGKTALLRHLAYTADERLFPDGVLYLRVRGTALADLLLGLFDLFYEREGGWKPTDAEVRRGLGGKRALVLLDDVELARDDVEALLNAVPGCAFVLAATERRLWGDGSSLQVRGLPPEASLALLERELGRAVTPEEREQARQICTALSGHPLRILQAAADVRKAGHSLADVAVPPQALMAAVLDGLPPAERRVLTALLAVDGVPLSAEHVAGITGMTPVLPELEHLEQRVLAQQHSPAYSPTGSLVTELGAAWADEIEEMRERALLYFLRWAAANRGDATKLAESAEAMMVMMNWGAVTGRWREVWQLGHLLEGALALSGRWAAWEQVLNWMLEAAQALGEQGLEGWALHQLGTRALCVGDKTTARTALTQALHLREMLGDEAGAAVTRHNLDLLLLAPPPPQKPPQEPPGKPPAARPRLPRWLLPVVGGGAALLLVGAAVLGVWVLRDVIWPPVTAEPVVPAVPPTEPWVHLEMDDGCDREYNSGAMTKVSVEANIRGRAVVYIGESTIQELSLESSQPASFPWTLDLGAGEYALEVDLYDASGQWAARSRCTFFVAEEPPPPEMLDPDLTPRYGSRYLYSSCPERQSAFVEMSAEGPIDLRSLGANCVGFTTQEPTFAVDWEGSADQVNIFFDGDGDTTLAVRGPDGGWYCNDDSPDSRNPYLAFSGAPRGQYLIWVGVYASGSVVDGVLTFEPFCVDTQPPPAPTSLSPGNMNLEYQPRLYPCFDVVFQWDAVTDQSGIKDYQVELERTIDPATWETDSTFLERIDDVTRRASYLSQAYLYRWRVRAIDGVGNEGLFSEWYYFSCQY